MTVDDVVIAAGDLEFKMRTVARDADEAAAYVEPGGREQLVLASMSEFLLASAAELRAWREAGESRANPLPAVGS